jgi:hypothetical protein
LKKAEDNPLELLHEIQDLKQKKVEEAALLGVVKIEAENTFKRCTVKQVKKIAKRKGYNASRSQIYNLLRQKLGGKWR